MPGSLNRCAYCADGGGGLDAAAAEAVGGAPDSEGGGAIFDLLAAAGVARFFGSAAGAAASSAASVFALGSLARCRLPFLADRARPVPHAHDTTDSRMLMMPLASAGTGMVSRFAVPNSDFHPYC